jgi:hypothetical protein
MNACGSTDRGMNQKRAPPDPGEHGERRHEPAEEPEEPEVVEDVRVEKVHRHAGDPEPEAV